MAKNKIKKIPQNYMDTVMVRNPLYKWSENKDGTVVIDVINKGLHNSIAQKFFHKPKTSHISLDKYGSVLWKSVNGTNTVYDILNIMSEAFPDEKDNMLKRVIAFMQTLYSNKYISYKK
ncbi:MAG: PqqD family protein [Lachnospiraceae bacterium]|nr:PqqD family protein [Lachnospiraceae bacterium]